MARSVLAEEAGKLLEATESLARVLAIFSRMDVDTAEDTEGSAAEGEGESGGEALARAYACREEAFLALQTASLSGHTPDAATRALLDRIGELDREMIESGLAEFDAVRDALNSLNRRRSAVAAHQTREREAPRFIEVKA